MSYTKYKIILLIYLILLAIPPIFIKLSSSRFQDMSIEGMYAYYVIAVVLCLSLLGFIIYAKDRTIENCNKRITPSKLLPAITVFLIMHFIYFSITSYVIYRTLDDFLATVKTRSEKSLSKTYELTVDESIPPENRSNRASIHYRQTGEKVYYLNENGKQILYEPDKLAETNRDEFVKTKNHFDAMLNYLIYTSVANILIIIGVLATYIYIRRNDKLKEIAT